MSTGDRMLFLFEDPAEDFDLPELQEGPFDQAFDEIELLGFSLRPPFELLENPEKYPAHEFLLSDDLENHIGKLVKILGYYVCRKPVRTVKGQLMSFGTWLDSGGKFFDTTHFPNFLKQFPFRGKGVYAIEGKVVEDFDFPGIEVIRMERLPFVKDERYE